MAIIKKLKAVKIKQNHLLGIQDISFSQVTEILKQAKTFITLNKGSSKKLSKNVTIPITMWDERLSSEASFKITKELGTNVSKRVSKLDMNAAAFILQGAIDYLTNN